MSSDSFTLAEDDEMYRLLRYAVEAFFLTFDSFCELIYLKKFERDYLLKKIFINKAKNINQKRNKLFLVQIGSSFCLFSNFKGISSAEAREKRRTIENSEADLNENSSQKNQGRRSKGRKEGTLREAGKVL